MPFLVAAGTTADRDLLRDAPPVSPELPQPLERFLETHRPLIGGSESTFPAPPGYRLPWLEGTTHTVTQAPGEGPTHWSLQAWDFDLSYELVVAARGGRVSMVRDSERLGGCDPAFSTRANYVVIDHGDGTSALYLHIDYQGALVEEGTLVAAGRTIAYSGSSGLSCGDGGWAGPHLHFQVQRTVPDRWWSETIPVTFDELEGKKLVTGRSYVSENRPSDLVSRARASWLSHRPARGQAIYVSPSRSFLTRQSDSTGSPPPAADPPTAAPLDPTPTPRPTPLPTPAVRAPPKAASEAGTRVTYKVVNFSSYFSELCSESSGGCTVQVCASSGSCYYTVGTPDVLSQGFSRTSLSAGEYVINFSGGGDQSYIRCNGLFRVPEHNYIEIVTSDVPACSIRVAVRL